MRLWSLHPQYLDPQGLVALWRESLLAQKVLQGKTKGYRHHPQLDRFKSHPYPLKAIATYLDVVQKEACRRGYCFDRRKIGKGRTRRRIAVGKREVKEEFAWLLSKLKKRDPDRYHKLRGSKKIRRHPLFNS
ncbi:MAG: pyrimidine dimer DNA glycosylase/endonuclease V [Candidatus Margulisiibacteriota bacterium]